MSQCWNDLLFAHWPIPAAQMLPLIPRGLELDTFDGSAWVGVVPFWMDRVRTRIAGETTVGIPTTGSFAELNLRTYVRSPRSGKHGVYFFSLDCASALAVLGARTLFHLPYFLADMHYQEQDGQMHYRSRRLLTRKSVRVEASYSPLEQLAPSVPGSLEHFLTERYCLFTAFRGRVLVGDIHHRMWPLHSAEAEFRVNELPAAHGIVLPSQPPVLHFSLALEVWIWPLRPDVA